MTFGKLGRPPEGRLTGQLEIYEAVSPFLIKHTPQKQSASDSLFTLKHR